MVRREDAPFVGKSRRLGTASPLEVYITVNEPEATQDKGKFGLKVILGS